ncbi:MAG: CRISPR-associated ring nuclease [Candidatus Methanoperedens sp.]|nr:CRISPR-associated ring nuclease [Candidatus Methanoperedens sp.]
MNVWITTVGSSPFAVINTLWAACELDDFVPEKMYFLCNDKMASQINLIKEWITRITHEYGKNVSFVEKRSKEEDFISYSKLVKSLITDEREQGNVIAIDITPGRKIMSAFSMFYGLLPDGADRVYYLHLFDVKKYGNKSFIDIPADEHNLINMKEMVA